MVDSKSKRVILLLLLLAATSAAGCLTPFALAAAGAARGTPVKASEAPEGQDIVWRMVGPGGGGWIQSIAWDPHNADLLYVGCDVGGFYLSTDGGRHYEIRNHGLRNYFVEAIAVHPRDSRILLLATEGGIYRTTDRGKSWRCVRKGFPPVQRYAFSAPIGCVCFDPLRPNVAYAGVGRPRWDRDGHGAIYRSDDTGLTWREVAAGQLPADAIVSDIEVRPDDSRVVLAATSRGVFRSEDEGRTWKPSSDGLPHRYAEELAFAPSAPGVVYLSLRTTARDGRSWNGGVFRSDDAGRTWRAANGPGMHDRVGKSGESPYMTSNIKELAVDPRNADVVYAGDRDWVTAGVLKTADGGKTWRQASRNSGRDLNMRYGWIGTWGPSVECMAVSPADPQKVVIGTSGHVFVTEDSGKTWQQRYCKELPDGRIAGNGLEVTCPHSLLPDPARPRRVYFCCADIGLLISDDNGRSFRRSYKGMKHEGNCFTVVVDPARPATLWAGTGQWAWNAGDICRSDDGGATWKVAGNPDTGLPDGQTKHLLLDPSSPAGTRRLVAACNGHGVYETRDGGKTWHAINGDLPPEAAKAPRGLLLDPADPAHLVAAFGSLPEKGAGIYETRDGGATWKLLNAGFQFADIQCLAADPREFATLYLGAREFYDRTSRRPYAGGVFKSTDGGRSWRQVLDDRFVDAIAIHPRRPQVLYAGTNDHPFHDDYAAEGLLKSSDGGATWTRENTGLSLLNVTGIAVSPHDPSLLYLSTGGNSAFVGRESGRRR